MKNQLLVMALSLTTGLCAQRSLNDQTTLDSLENKGWYKAPVVDKFGDLTGEVSLVHQADMKFGNSATLEGYGVATMSFEGKTIHIKLMEYDRSYAQFGVGSGYGGNEGTISFKLPDGTVLAYHPWVYKEQMLMNLNKPNKPKWWTKLEKWFYAGTEKAKVVYEIGTSTYRFDMTPLGDVNILSE